MRSPILEAIHPKGIFFFFFYCFCDLGWRKGVINLTACQNPQFTECYFNIIIHKISSFLWFSVVVLVYLNVPTPVFLSRLIEVGSKMKHFCMSLRDLGRFFEPLFWKWKIKYKILTFSFEKPKLTLWGQQGPHELFSLSIPLILEIRLSRRSWRCTVKIGAM